MATFSDSVGKIITTYFQCVAKEPFTYYFKSKEMAFEPQKLNIQPGLFRNLTCYAKCGACCPRFSLDYLPEPLEKHPYRLRPRNILFSGRHVPVWSDLQDRSDDRFCANLNKINGFCGIHGEHPFSCDFEIIRFFIFKEANNRISTAPYGRAWNMMRIDGKRGTLCTIEDGFEKSKIEVLRKLNRLKQWTDHFQLQTMLPEILLWIESLDREPMGMIEFDPAK